MFVIKSTIKKWTASIGNLTVANDRFTCSTMYSPSKAAFAPIKSPIDTVHFSNTIPLFRNFMTSYHICSSIQIDNMEWIILGKYCFQQGNVSISSQDSSNNKFNLKSCGCRWTCKELNPESMEKDEEHRNV